MILAVLKYAPALIAGNTVVLKPSPYTPLTTLRMGELFSEVLPPGVLNVISGGDELGSRLTQHPLVRKISFTGSVAGGKQVAAAAAQDLIDCGTVWINQHDLVGMYAPFGGAKWSGIGEEYGSWGLDEYFQRRVVNIAK